MLEKLRGLRVRGLRHVVPRKRALGLRIVKTAFAAAIAWELSRGLCSRFGRS